MAILTQQNKPFLYMVKNETENYSNVFSRVFKLGNDQVKEKFNTNDLRIMLRQWLTFITQGIVIELTRRKPFVYLIHERNTV